MILYYLLMFYLVVINFAGFLIMGIDKKKAEKKRWRIPEKTFFIVSALGSWAGMYTFHHKTKHWYFVVGIPAIFCIELALAIFIAMRFL